ncbi:hypothetical protein HQ571_06055 [Candidatus Kuenenbacteria bacterium]|nr:hypothetical protein [Candidatus Kuenenbacteria bacterium]
MTNREPLFKGKDFGLPQMSEFVNAFARVGGSPAMIQLAIEDKLGMEKVVEVFCQLELPYADERVVSNVGYPAGFQHRHVDEQTARLLELFPGLDDKFVKTWSPDRLHKKAEFTAVIPDPLRIAGDYHKALVRAVELLKTVHGDKFKNWREGALTSEHLRLVEKTAQTHKMLTEKQNGDFWVFDAQFGKRWAGASVRHGRARYLAEEFGLGPYEVAILLLTHPDRITGPDQLYIDCAGCEYRVDVSEGAFPFCLDFYWHYYCKLMVLYHISTDNASERWGSASGFAS